MLVGREREARRIRELVTSALTDGAALLLVGEPGIGKSALVAVARQSAAAQGLTVLATTGVPAESRLPYAGLHQLLLPLRDGIEVLEGPQRTAIQSVFGKGGDHVADRFLVAMAVTDLLRATARRRPLLVLADDIHWLDPATCDVLAFVARRLSGERIALIATTRDGYDLSALEAGLPELSLTGLSEEAARRLLRTTAPALSQAAEREILDASLGNPLALTELSAVALVGDARPVALGTGSAITQRLEKAFAARWSELPAETRDVVLVAALHEGGAITETLQAASQLTGSDLTSASIAPAISARLLDAGPGWLRFRHPLIRSAIENRAGLDQRTAAHEALASVLSDQPDRRAWHRAGAALRPDSEVAADLDSAATRAEQRAAIGVAIAALERAAELSPDSAARNSRLLRAAQLSFELGRPALVDRFAHGVDRTVLSLCDTARLAILEESIEAGSADGAERVRYLAGLAGEVAVAGQSDLAMDLLLGAAWRCRRDNPGKQTRSLVAASALALSADPAHPVLLAVIAYAAPDVYGEAARDGLAAAAVDAGIDAVQLAHLGVAAAILGLFGKARALLGSAIPQLREQHRFGLLVRALNHDANSALYACQWDDAIAQSQESARIAAEAQQHRWVALAKLPRAFVAGLRGQDKELEELAVAAEQVLLPGAGRAVSPLQIARGLAALGRGDYGEAYGYLKPVFEPTDRAFNNLLRMYHIGDLADAASHCGKGSEARELIAQLSNAATQEPGPLLAASMAFATAMLAADHEAKELFEQALNGPDLPGWPLYYARLQLEYGGWLRRHRHIALSREHLRAARDALEALGAAAWQGRAEAELRAAGERSATGTSHMKRYELLTAQEQQIALLVLRGLSNKQIGERLSVSHRTVAYHLYRMFPKLGITARAELGPVLAQAGLLGARSGAEPLTG